MILAPAVTAQQAEAALTDCLNSLQDARARWSGAASRADVETMRDMYLAWVETAETLLAGVFQEGGPTDGLFTTRWTEIRRLLPGAPRPEALVRGEANRQQSRLEAAVRAVRQMPTPQAAGPLDTEATRAVLDTNVLLRVNVVSAKWTELLNAATVRLIVPRVVLRELDDLKNRGGHLGRRAATVTAQLLGATDDGERRSGPLTAGVSVEIVQDPPGHRPTLHADEELVALAQLLADMPGGPLVVVTGDAGAKVAARARGLAYASPPAAWQLPDADPAEREAEKLRKQLAELTVVRPSLKVVFQATGSNRLVPPARAAAPPGEDYEVEAARRELPLSGVRGRRDLLGGAGTVSDEARRARHGEVRDWARERDRRRGVRASGVVLPLAVLNDGGAAAADVLVTLAAPPAYRLLPDVDLTDGKRPTAPSPPFYVVPLESEFDVYDPDEATWEVNDGPDARTHLRLVRQGGTARGIDQVLWLVRKDHRPLDEGVALTWQVLGTHPPVNETGRLHLLPRVVPDQPVDGPPTDQGPDTGGG